MASTSSPAPAVAPVDQMATDAFLSSLAELRSMPHTHVNEKPIGKAERPNDFGVLVRLTIPESERKQKRFAVTGPKGDRPNLVAATQEAIKWVKKQLTEAGIEATLPEQPPPQQAATSEELEQLAAWIDEQPDPGAITMELALDWLHSQRAKASGAATMALLMDRQLAEAHVRAAERQLNRAQQRLERMRGALPLSPNEKRQRTVVADHPRVAQGGENPPNWEHFAGYSRETYQGEEVKEQDRRAIPIDRSRTDHSLPRGDESRGWFSHWRRGVGGVLRGWAGGSLGAVAHMLAESARRFEVVDLLADKLGLARKEEVRKAETEARIVDQLEAALAETKHCRTEQQRQEHGTLLCSAAPARDSGMIERFAKRLGVSWGTRSKKDGEAKGRPTAFDAAIDRREKFGEDVKLQTKRLEPGDRVLSKGDECEFTRYVWNHPPGFIGPVLPGCVLTFRSGDAYAEKEYQCLYHKRPGSARIQRLPPTLAPPPRKTKGEEERTKRHALIREHALEMCAISPNKRDQKRRHVGPRLWVMRPALILLMPIYQLCAMFMAKHPGGCLLITRAPAIPRKPRVCHHRCGQALAV